MSRSTLRLAVAAALLAALLLPAAASAWEPTLPAHPAERGLVAAFWAFLDTLFPGIGPDNRWTIDPNGATAACDNRWTIDPNGGGSCSTSDNRWTIDPDG